MLFKVSPVPSVCVKDVSESVPKFNTAESDPRVKSSPTVKSPLNVALPLASKITAFAAGNVQKIVLVPDDQSTALLELELARIVVLASVVPEEVKVPRPTSKSELSVQQ